MVLILMSATVDMEELREAIPGACEIEIGKHEFEVKRFYLERSVAPQNLKTGKSDQKNCLWFFSDVFLSDLAFS